MCRMCGMYSVGLRVNIWLHPKAWTLCCWFTFCLDIFRFFSKLLLADLARSESTESIISFVQCLKSPLVSNHYVTTVSYEVLDLELRKPGLRRRFPAEKSSSSEAKTDLKGSTTWGPHEAWASLIRPRWPSPQNIHLRSCSKARRQNNPLDG